jgi:hypothetical protein
MKVAVDLPQLLKTFIKRVLRINDAISFRGIKCFSSLILQEIWLMIFNLLINLRTNLWLRFVSTKLQQTRWQLRNVRIQDLETLVARLLLKVVSFRFTVPH